MLVVIQGKLRARQDMGITAIPLDDGQLTCSFYRIRQSVFNLVHILRSANRLDGGRFPIRSDGKSVYHRIRFVFPRGLCLPKIIRLASIVGEFWKLHIAICITGYRWLDWDSTSRILIQGKFPTGQRNLMLVHHLNGNTAAHKAVFQCQINLLYGSCGSNHQISLCVFRNTHRLCTHKRIARLKTCQRGLYQLIGFTWL